MKAALALLLCAMVSFWSAPSTAQQPPALSVKPVVEKRLKELPQGRFVEIPRAVHTLHEDNPEAVLAALRKFLTF